MPTIELHDVGLRYFSRQGEVEALNGISLSIHAGEFIAIVGPSGCGKSTLLSLISGLLQRTSGSILLDGTAIDRPARQIGNMLQQNYLFEWRTRQRPARR